MVKKIPAVLVRELRENLGDTRDTFRKRLKLKSVHAISNYERGYRYPSEAIAYKMIGLAKTLGWQWDVWMLRPLKK